VANDEPARDTTLRRRRSPRGLDIDFAYDDGASGAPFHATVRRARHGAATTVTVNGPAAEGSGDIFAHVRPGTCSRVSGPEIAFDLLSDDAEHAAGRVTAPLPFETFTARSHVLELHRGTDARIAACASL